MFNDIHNEECVNFSNSGAKAYAVAILSAVWAGAKLPKEFIRHANRIKRQMEKDGTWARA
jgi:hypothetical protein